MKKLLILSAMASSIFTSPMFGMLGTVTKAKTSLKQRSRQTSRLYSQKKSNSQAIPTTVREYLQQEEEKTSQKLAVFEKEFNKKITKESSKLEYLPEEMQILYAEVITSEVLKEFVPKTAPVVFRERLLNKMRECLENDETQFSSEEEKLEHCLQQTSNFIDEKYKTIDSPEHKAITKKEWSKIKKQLQRQFLSQKKTDANE